MVCWPLSVTDAVFMNPLFCSMSESNHLGPYNTNLINNGLLESAIATSQVANKLDFPRP